MIDQRRGDAWAGTDGNAVTGWKIYGGVGVVGSLAYPWFPQPVQTLWYDAVGVSVVAALLVCAAASRRPDRSPWLLFAAAQTAYTVGDIAWNITLAREGEVPTASYLDVPYFLYYPFALLGLIQLLRRRRAGREVDATIDAVIVGVAVTMLTLVLLRPIVEDKTITPLERSVSLGYPVLDIVLLVLAMRLSIGAGRRCASFRLLVGSLLVTTVADLTYAALAWRSSYTEGGFLDVAWLLGYVAFGVAALHPSRGELTQPSTDLPNPLRRGRIGLLAIAGLLPPGLLAVASAFGEQVNLPFVVAGSTVLYLLVLLRVVRLLRRQDLAIQREHVLRRAGHDLVVATTDADVQRAIAVAAERLLGPATPRRWTSPRRTEPTTTARTSSHRDPGTPTRPSRCPATASRVARWWSPARLPSTRRRAARSRRWRPKPRSPSRRWHATNGAAAVNDDLSPLCTRPLI
jgi:hypothetical protein